MVIRRRTRFGRKVKKRYARKVKHRKRSKSDIYASHQITGQPRPYRLTLVTSQKNAAIPFAVCFDYGKSDGRQWTWLTMVQSQYDGEDIVNPSPPPALIRTGLQPTPTLLADSHGAPGRLFGGSPIAKPMVRCLSRLRHIYDGATGVTGPMNLPSSRLSPNYPQQFKYDNLVASNYKLCRINHFTTYITVTNESATPFYIFTACKTLREDSYYETQGNQTITKPFMGAKDTLYSFNQQDYQSLPYFFPKLNGRVGLNEFCNEGYGVDRKGLMSGKFGFKKTYVPGRKTVQFPVSQTCAELAGGGPPNQAIVGQMIGNNYDGVRNRGTSKHLKYRMTRSEYLKKAFPAINNIGTVGSSTPQAQGVDASISLAQTGDMPVASEASYTHDTAGINCIDDGNKQPYIFMAMCPANTEDGFGRFNDVWTNSNTPGANSTIPNLPCPTMDPPNGVQRDGMSNNTAILNPNAFGHKSSMWGSIKINTSMNMTYYRPIRTKTEETDVCSITVPGYVNPPNSLDPHIVNQTFTAVGVAQYVNNI